MNLNGIEFGTNYDVRFRNIRSIHIFNFMLCIDADTYFRFLKRSSSILHMHKTTIRLLNKDMLLFENYSYKTYLK